MWTYQLSTKGKVWKHEQEVRLVIVDPSMMTPYYVPKEFDRKEIVDYKEIRFVPKIGGECFNSVYLGVNIEDDMKNKIINKAKGLNPEIKIYQMKVDANAFKLKTESII